MHPHFLQFIAKRVLEHHVKNKNMKQNSKSQELSHSHPVNTGNSVNNSVTKEAELFEALTKPKVTSNSTSNSTSTSTNSNSLAASILAKIAAKKKGN